MLMCNGLGNIKVTKDYICNICKEDITFGYDCYTGCYWVNCKNNKCKEFEKVKTYVNIEEYRDINEK